MVEDDLAVWIATHILPHEADVRRWLRRSSLVRSDEDDLIQEAYCRLAGLADRSGVRSGRAYFFTVVRNLMLERLRRERIVRIDSAEIDLARIADTEPSPERQYTGRQQLALVQRLIEDLPEPMRSVFRLRKVECLSQRQTSERLGLSENIIEKHVASGLRLILQRFASDDGAMEGDRRPSFDGQGNQRRN